jgi:hypothetical protein
MNLKPQKFDWVHLIAVIGIFVFILYVAYAFGQKAGYERGLQIGANTVLRDLEQRGIIKIQPKKTQEVTDENQKK